jgi:hypothetical protein
MSKRSAVLVAYVVWFGIAAGVLAVGFGALSGALAFGGSPADHLMSGITAGLFLLFGLVLFWSMGAGTPFAVGIVGFIAGGALVAAQTDQPLQIMDWLLLLVCLLVILGGGIAAALAADREPTPTELLHRAQDERR